MVIDAASLEMGSLRLLLRLRSDRGDPPLWICVGIRFAGLIVRDLLRRRGLFTTLDQNGAAFISNDKKTLAYLA